MNLKQRLQLAILSISVVAFFVLIFIYFIAKDENNALVLNTNNQDYLKVEDESISFYLDENNNQTKDTGEELCTQCVGKQILIEIHTDIGNDVVSRNIETDSVILIKSTRISSLWGYFSEEKLIIPYYSFNINQEGKDIEIPVLRIGYELAGENSNIESIEVKELSENNLEITMLLTKLVPVLNDYLNTKKPLWLIYYPNLDAKSNYYLSSTTINGAEVSRSTIHSLWHFLGKYNTTKSRENYKILTPIN